MFRWSRVLFVSALLVLAAPAAGQNPVERDYAPYKKRGTAVVSGQAFATTRGGDVKYAAGSTVILNPATWYTTEFWWNVNMTEDEDEPDPVAVKYSKTAIADGEGRFSFAGVPAGSYYLLTQVSWLVDAGPSEEYARKIGTTYVRLGELVAVKTGEHKKVVLNPVAVREKSTHGKWTEYK